MFSVYLYLRLTSSNYAFMKCRADFTVTKKSSNTFFVPIYADAGDRFLDRHSHKHLYKKYGTDRCVQMYSKGSHVDISKR